MSTCSKVCIAKETLVHTRLDTEVKNHIFLTVINTSHTSHIRFLVIRPYLFNNRCWEVLQSCLAITIHELLTINLDSRHLLTIDGNLTVFANLSTRQTLHELFNNRALWSTISSCIIYKGILFHNKLLSHTLSYDFLQHYGIGSHIDLSESNVLAFSHGNVTIHITITDVGHSQNVLSIFWNRDLERAILCRCSSRNIRRVSLQQLNSRLHKRLLCLFVINCTAYDTVLSHCPIANEQQRSKCDKSLFHIMIFIMIFLF